MSSPFSASSAFAAIFAKHKASSKSTAADPAIANDDHRPPGPTIAPPGPTTAAPAAATAAAKTPTAAASGAPTIVPQLLRIASTEYASGQIFEPSSSLVDLSSDGSWLSYSQVEECLRPILRGLQNQVNRPFQNLQRQQDDVKLVVNQLCEVQQVRKDCEVQEQEYLQNDDFESLDILNSKIAQIDRDELTLKLDLITALLNGCVFLNDFTDLLYAEGKGLWALRHIAHCIAVQLKAANSDLSPEQRVDELKQTVRTLESTKAHTDNEIKHAEELLKELEKDPTLTDLFSSRDSVASTVSELTNEQKTLEEEISMLTVRLGQAKLKLENAIDSRNRAVNELRDLDDRVSFEKQRNRQLMTTTQDNLDRLLQEKEETEKQLDLLRRQISDLEQGSDPLESEATLAEKWINADWQEAQTQEKDAAESTAKAMIRTVETGSRRASLLRNDSDSALRSVVPDLCVSDSYKSSLLDQGRHLRSLCDLLQKSKEDLQPQHTAYRDQIWALEEEIHRIEADQLPQTIQAKNLAVKAKNFKAAALRSRELRNLEERLDTLKTEKESLSRHSDECESRLENVTTALDSLLNTLKNHLLICLQTDLKMQSLLVQHIDLAAYFYSNLAAEAPQLLKSFLPIIQRSLVVDLQPPGHECLNILGIEEQDDTPTSSKSASSEALLSAPLEATQVDESNTHATSSIETAATGNPEPVASEPVVSEPVVSEPMVSESVVPATGNPEIKVRRVTLATSIEEPPSSSGLSDS